MVQDIAPSVFSNAYTPCPPDERSRVVMFRGKSMIVSEQNWNVPLISELPEQKGSFRYLFSIDSVRYYLAAYQEKIPGYALHSLYEIRAAAPRKELFAAYTAYHLYTWYENHRFCGKCGGKTVHDDHQRMLYCPACQLQVFPTISPAVIIGVTNGERLLLSKYAHGSYSHYALLAGFTEIGETVEETVRREVREETGLEVQNIRYWGSQPWGCDCGVLMGFFCDLKSSDRIHIDETELAVAEWKNWKEVPDGIDDVSLTSEMMRAFRKQWMQ